MRLIDADELLKTSFRVAGKIGNKYPFESIAISEIKASPTIDPESLRERGQWIMQQDNTGVCSNCHRQDHIDPLAKYCRYCGAEMCEED